MCSSTAGIALYLFAPDSFLLFGDAVSHIVRSRQFIDSQQTGLLNIGTVWLPLPHLMLIPFVSVDALFYSGTAGAFLGIPLLVSIVVLLYHLLACLTGSTRIAFFISLLFGLNPNIVYIALTPMSEIPLLFFLTAGAFTLLKFVRSNRLWWGILSAAAVLLATLCRYEAWILAPFITIVIISSIKSSQLQGESPSLRRLVLTAIIPWIGIMFWFGWNGFQYGDPLKFAHWTFDVGTIAVRDTLRASPQEMFRILGTAVLWIFGPMMTLAGLLMIFSVRRLNKHREQLVVLLYCALPMFFTTAAILLGFVQIDQWWWNWRFVLPFGLFLSVASALVLKEVRQKFISPTAYWTAIIIFGVVPFTQFLFPSIGIALYKDATKSYEERSRAAAAFGEDLGTLYSGGSIALMTGYGVGQRIMISSRLPLNYFTVHYFPAQLSESNSDRYIIIGMDARPESKEFSGFWNENKLTLSKLYRILREDRFFILLQHR